MRMKVYRIDTVFLFSRSLSQKNTCTHKVHRIKSASANSKITNAAARQSDRNNIKVTEMDTAGAVRPQIQNVSISQG